MIEPTWTSPCGRATLYCGDCATILPTLGKVDAVVTDPPYAVNGSSGTIGNSRHHKTSYSGALCDTMNTIDAIVVPAVVFALDLAGGRGIITPGNRAVCHYPDPSEVGMVHQPATVSLGPWGRVQSQPILFYGRDPMVGKRIQDTVYRMTEPASTNLHPCAKPLGFAKWCIERVSILAEAILDPFMGSGTTGVAAIKLGRRFIGIEIDPGYFAIARRRIEEALLHQDGGPMFAHAEPQELF